MAENGEGFWPVRNVLYNPHFGTLDELCRSNGEEGYALLRIVAVSNFEAVAVFAPHAAPAPGTPGEEG